jgi:tetratricopeptide (TPR) repeat protein
MALANVAALLAKWGRRVLVVDWDLEASGIERYFLNENPDLAAARRKTPGVVDLVLAKEVGHPIPWRDCLLDARPFGRNPVRILSAGQLDGDYNQKLHGLNFQKLFAENALGTYIEDLRNDWIREFDVVLVDSRTGISDIGGICTIHLPDVLVLLFTTTDSSVDGVIDVMNRARTEQARLPFDRNLLLGLPVPARDESQTEYEKAKAWHAKIADRFGTYYEDWLPRDLNATDVLKILRIPYIPNWSFGERLPVKEEGTSDPRSLGYAYQVLARLVDSELQWDQVLSRDSLGLGRSEEATGGVEERSQVAGILMRRGELDEALRILRTEVLPVHERLGDVRSTAVTQGQVAEILTRQGDLAAALTIRREQVLAFARLGDLRERALTMGYVADILQARGELDESLRIRREEELPVYERLGDVRRRALTMGKVADILQARGELDEALRIRREEELPVFERLGDVRSRAITLGQVTDILQARGELDEALRILREELLPVYERLGDVRERAVTMGKVADILQARGELDEALRIRREEELPVYERLGDVRSRAVCLANIAVGEAWLGNLTEADQILAEEVTPALERLGDRVQLVSLGFVHAKIKLGLGQPGLAGELATQALNDAEQLRLSIAAAIREFLGGLAELATTPD